MDKTTSPLFQVGLVALICAVVSGCASTSPKESATAAPPAGQAAARTVSPGTYQWSPPVHISEADSVLNQPGTILAAACFGATDSSITVTLSNGVKIVFKGDGSVATCTGSGATTGAFSPNTTGNSDFDTVLGGFEYDDGPHQITLNGLTDGKRYSVQLFALDNRTDTGENAREFNFADPANSADVSQTAKMGDNVYVMATFVAHGNSMVIQENLPDDNNGNLNALVLRQLP